MASATFTKFNSFVGALGNKTMNLGSGGDTFKAILTDTLPIATQFTYAAPAIGELTTANGYTAGGVS